jgi:GNAT superfamily N-acetyltransferase
LNAPARIRATIRRATLVDASAIAKVHVDAWRAAYEGLLPSDYLADLSVSERRRRWTEALQNPNSRATVVVAELRGRTAGFASAGPSRDDDAPGSVGEVYAIYVHPEHWRRGIGSLLEQAALAFLADAGFADATLWALTGNMQALRFYTDRGWALDGSERTKLRDSITTTEVRYRKALHNARC